MPAPTSKASAFYRTMRKGLDNPKHTGSSSASGDSSILDSPVFGNMDVLPSELVVEILLLLPVYELLKCRGVSKVFRDVVDNDPEVQYHMELQIAGLASAESARALPFTERIRLLRGIQLARTRRYMVQERPLSITRPLGERFGDVFCYAYRTETFEEEGLDNAVRCVSIVGRGPDTPLVDFWELTFEEGFSRLTADPERNVLVLLRPDTMNHAGQLIPSVRILSLHDGTPLAPNSDPESWAEVSHLEGYSRCKLRGRSLGLIKVSLDEESTPGPDNPGVLEVCVADWRTGMIKAHLVRRGTAHSRSLGLDAFAFLSDSVFVLAVHYRLCIALEVYTISSPSSTLTPRHVATFEFPSWVPGCVVSPCAALGSSLQDGGKRPFKPSQDTEMIILGNVKIESEMEWRPHPRVLWFAICARVLLDAALSSDMASEPRRIPWSAWGPSHTRCFDYNSVRGPLPCAVNGSRVLTKDRPQPKDNPGIRDKGLHGFILDFHLLPYRRPLPQSRKRGMLAPVFGGGGPQARTVVTPSVVPRRSVFQEDVVTELAYRQIPVEWPGSFFRRAENAREEKEREKEKGAVHTSELWVFASLTSRSLEYYALSF